MFLSDKYILQAIAKGRLYLDPFEQRLLRPASVCLRVGSSQLDMHAAATVDPSCSDSYPVATLAAIPDEGCVIEAGSFILVNTLERITVSRMLCGFIFCVSGLQRLGLDLASSLVSPGYGENSPSTLTLELRNHSKWPIRLHSGMRVCHLVLAELTSPSCLGYDADIGLYSDQSIPAQSCFYKNWK